MNLQSAKDLVRAFYADFGKCTPDAMEGTMKKYCHADYSWRGMYPFNEFSSVSAVCEKYWKPLRHALSNLQRRPDIFMAGINVEAKDESVWVVSMGNLMGLHDKPWLHIPPTRKMAFMRYCEFNQVKDGKIIHQASWFDIPQLMVQAGVNPFPPQTGAEFWQPGPMTHTGLLYTEQNPAEGKKTLKVMNDMIASLGNWDNALSLEEELKLQWHDDMIWWGPTGIGSSYTIERYAKQHSGPMRKTCTNRVFNGHLCKFAEGEFGGWFGWPNLTFTTSGNFLGMPACNIPSDMRVIDIYRREGDKLAENWVFIDMLKYCKIQGLDILQRLEESQCNSFSMGS